MAALINQHQHQKQQDSGATFLKSLATTAFFTYGVDCYNVQHDGGIGQKTVKHTISDVSRTKFFKFGDFGVVMKW